MTSKSKAIALLVSAASCLPVCAQQNGANAAGQTQALIAFRRAPLAEFVQDPKDARLKAAVAMLGDRLGELPREIPQGKMDPAAFDLIPIVTAAVASPSRFAITFNPTSNAGGAFGYGMVMSSLFSDAATPRSLQDFVEKAMASEGHDLPRRSREYPDMRETRTPAGRLVFGPRDFESGHGYEVQFGTVEDPDAAFTALPAPSIEGLNAIVVGSFDLGALTPLANLGQMGLNHKMQEDGHGQLPLVEKLSKFGVIGDHAMKGTFELGYTKDAMRSRVRVENTGTLLEFLGLKTGKLVAKHFAPIPADAISASVGLLNFDAITNVLKELRAVGAPVDEVLGAVKERTGVDLEQDLFPALGGAGVMYSSDTCGGNGFGSTVALLGIRDREALIKAHRQLCEAAAVAMQRLAEQEEGAWAKYIKVRGWDAEGSPAFTLAFPGLPVPVEVSWAATEQWLVVAATPQALVAAVRQATGKGGKDILSRGDWRLDLGKHEYLSVTLSDTQRLIRDGYGTVTLVGSAIGNMVRSPLGAARDPGMIVPLYADLCKGVRTSVRSTYREAELLVMESDCDPSLLVNIAAASGSYGSMASFFSMLSSFGGIAKERGLNLPDLSLLAPRHETAQERAVASLRSAIEGPMVWTVGDVIR